MAGGTRAKEHPVPPPDARGGGAREAGRCAPPHAPPPGSCPLARFVGLLLVPTPSRVTSWPEGPLGSSSPAGVSAGSVGSAVRNGRAPSPPYPFPLSPDGELSLCAALGSAPSLGQFCWLHTLRTDTEKLMMEFDNPHTPGIRTGIGRTARGLFIGCSEDSEALADKAPSLGRDRRLPPSLPTQFDSQVTKGERRQPPIYINCPLTSRHVPWHTHVWGSQVWWL